MFKILIICGPTATGKTALAAKLAQQFNGELISADSRQVYKGMDIVTGKDRPGGIVIHGLDLVEPDQDFSAAHFVGYASDWINQISWKGKLPIIVGGTGLYINSLVNPPQTLTVKPDWQLRKKLEEKSVKDLQEQLEKIDKTRWQIMNHSDRLNPRRLIRAIEVAQSNCGKIETAPKYACLWIGLAADKGTLDQKIETRVNSRIQQGAIKEWEELKTKHPVSLPSMSGIGYKQLPDVDKWIKAEQQYARRQMTFFKKNKQINWFNSDQEGNIVKLVDAWYTKAI